MACCGEHNLCLDPVTIHVGQSFFQVPRVDLVGNRYKFVLDGHNQSWDASRIRVEGQISSAKYYDLANMCPIKVENIDDLLNQLKLGVSCEWQGIWFSGYDLTWQRFWINGSDDEYLSFKYVKSLLISVSP